MVFRRFRRVLWILVALIVFSFTACSGAGAGGDGGGGSGDVQITGRLAGLVTGNRVGAPLGGSSLSSAVVTVGALPIVGGSLDIEAVEETEVAGDGAFALDVPTEPNIEHVFLVRAPQDGVGVEQGLGFIELPIGGEAAAGWDLSGSDGSTVDLGTLSGSADTFLADNAPQDLIDLLNADTAELLYIAQRDNFLKQAQNLYLNPDVPFDVLYIHTLPREDVPINDWEDPSTLGRLDAPNVTIMFQNLEQALFEGIRDGSRPFEIIAPQPVTPRVDGATPTTTITYEELNFPDDNPAFDLTLDLEFVSGIWEVDLDNETIAAYDWGLALPLDADGNILSYVPAAFVAANETTGRIETITLRWYGWDSAEDTYVEIDVDDSEDLPIAEGFSYELRPSSSGGGEFQPGIPIDLQVGQPVTVTADLYTPAAAAGNGGSELTWINIAYSIGGVVILTDMYLVRL